MDVCGVGGEIGRSGWLEPHTHMPASCISIFVFLLPDTATASAAAAAVSFQPQQRRGHRTHTRWPGLAAPSAVALALAHFGIEKSYRVREKLVSLPAARAAPTRTHAHFILFRLDRVCSTALSEPPQSAT